jgi:hypothetical protein
MTQINVASGNRAIIFRISNSSRCSKHWRRVEPDATVAIKAAWRRAAGQETMFPCLKARGAAFSKNVIRFLLER